MSLLRVASVPPAIVGPTASVMEAVETMAEHSVGAVAVVEDGKLLGIFTERDVMLRVVLRKRHPQHTRVEEVMTVRVDTVEEDVREEDALVRMVERHVRHFPVIDSEGKVAGMLSIRNLLQHRVEELARELYALDQYLSNDGPGG